MVSLAERQVLPHVPDLAARLVAGEELPGGWAGVEPAGQRLGHGVGDVALCLMRDVIWAPGTGMLYGAEGMPVQSALLAAGGRDLPCPGGREVFVARAAVFVGFGARQNYGHFLFDGVAGLAAMADLGLLSRYPAVAGRLHGWQREGLGLAGLAVAEVAAARVRIGEVIFVTAMNHYLHRCHGLLAPMVARMGGRGGGGGGRVVYLSRRGYAGRILLGEAELEAALAARGAVVLRPERMAVADQIAAMRGARVVVAASGAALANLVFAPEGARVVEIRPEPVREPWVDLTCDAMGLRHVVVPASVVPRGEVPLWTKIRQAPRWALRRYHYAVRVEVQAVLGAIGE